MLSHLIRPTGRLFHRCYSMELKEAVSILDKFAPPSLAEPWDNVGLLVQPYTPRKIKTVLVTNDLSEEVMAEAVEQGAELILSYHPPLFRPFKRITTGWKERIIACCLEKGIAIYSPHTAYDTLEDGVNDWLLKAFDLKQILPVQQKNVAPMHSHLMEVNSATGSSDEFEEFIIHSFFGDKVLVLPSTGDGCVVRMCCNEEDLPALTNLIENRFMDPDILLTKLEKVPLLKHGAGRKGMLNEPISIRAAVSSVKTHLKLQHVRVALAQGLTLESQIESVAVCAGSGVSVLRGVKADLWLTGEMSHHEVLDATHSGTTVILAEHSNSERGFLRQELKGTLSELFGDNVKIAISEKDRDPLQIV